MSGILAQDKKFDINLKQIAERVKKSSTIYNSISDAYLDEQFSFDNGDTFDFKLLLSIFRYISCSYQFLCSEKYIC